MAIGRKIVRLAFVGLLAGDAAGCATREVANFQPGPAQESIIRDGQAALVSHAPNSLVLVKPAARQFNSNARPIFVVGIYNLSSVPQEFRVANIVATQTLNQQMVQLQVIPYDALVQEERNRQVAAALVTGLAAGANAYSASQAYRNNATANAIVQANASRQNEQMIAATIEQGQMNLATLERSIIKDNTLMPGEWYGGQLHLQPLSKSDTREAQRTYAISLLVGQDRHVINVVQTQLR
jgi:hypothetical protein